MIKFILGVLCRVDAQNVGSVPHRGPLIIAANHINFLEIPLIYTLLQPRRVIGMAKRETWANPLLRFLANLWEAIPLSREGVDKNAFQRALQEIRGGSIVAVAPEGTRSGDGQLRRGSAGVVLLAQMSGAPILPIAHFGGERIWNNMLRLKRTRVTVRAGTPYNLEKRASGGRFARQQIVDDLMRRIAAMMPREYRGYYEE